jgi:hypothetical protein
MSLMFCGNTDRVGVEGMDAPLVPGEHDGPMVTVSTNQMLASCNVEHRRDQVNQRLELGKLFYRVRKVLMLTQTGGHGTFKDFFSQQVAGSHD